MRLRGNTGFQGCTRAEMMGVSNDSEGGSDADVLLAHLTITRDLEMHLQS